MVTTIEVTSPNGRMPAFVATMPAKIISNQALTKKAGPAATSPKKLRIASSHGVRSAAGRAAGEAIWVPTTLLPRFGIRWTALDDHHLVARYDVDAVEIQAHYSIDVDGRLLSMVFDRWGDPERSGTWGQHPFGGEITASTTFEGLTIPSAGRFGWFFGTDRWCDGEFFRYQITELHLNV